MPGNILGPTAEAVVNAAISYPLTGSDAELRVANTTNMSLLGRVLKQLKIIALQLSLMTDHEIDSKEIN